MIYTYTHACSCYAPASLFVFRSSVTDSLVPSLTHSHLAFSAKSSLFVVRFGRSLRFCHLGFDKEAISDGCRSEIVRYRWGVWILRDFRKLSFRGPCRLYFSSEYVIISSCINSRLHFIKRKNNAILIKKIIVIIRKYLIRLLLLKYSKYPYLLI